MLEKLARLLLCTTLLASATAGATPVLVGSGINGVTGINGLVDAAGESWDVFFQEGTCRNLYAPCGPGGADFVDQAEGQRAVDALTSFLQFGGQGTAFGIAAGGGELNTIVGAYDVLPSLSSVRAISSLLVLMDDGVRPSVGLFHPCRFAGDSCKDGWVISNSRVNDRVDGWSSGFSFQALRADDDTSLSTTTAIARFVRSTTSPDPVPAPGALLLCLFAFAAAVVRGARRAG